MKKIIIRDLPGNQKIGKEELKNVLGGIDTVPLPERQLLGYNVDTKPLYGSSTVMIGTWPTPESPLKSYGNIDPLPRLSYR